MLTHQRDLRLDPGRVDYAGRPCFRPADRLRPQCSSWCDRPTRFTREAQVSVDDVSGRGRPSVVRYVEITGGEPLLQADVYPFRGSSTSATLVLLETGGHRSIADVPDEVNSDRRRQVSWQRGVVEELLGESGQAAPEGRSEVRDQGSDRATSSPVTGEATRPDARRRRAVLAGARRPPVEAARFAVDSGGSPECPSPVAPGAHRYLGS